MLLKNALIPLGNRFVPSHVRLLEGVIADMGLLAPQEGEEVIDLGGDYLLPGFVEAHIHGCAGHDVMQGEEAIRAMSRALHGMGVSAFLPTTMSAPAEETRRVVAAVRAVMDHPEPQGARVLGAHLEAPFLSPGKTGAQRADCLLMPSWDALMDITGGDVGAVRVLTIAPELPGAEDVIRRGREAGIRISVGHTGATAEQVHTAADWGASRVTHLFNAQTPLHHRDPGVPGAALTDDRLYTEFIGDGIHLHGDIVRLIARCKGEKAVAITDAMEAAGLPDGQYALGGQPVTVKHGAARLSSGTLAGSVLTLRHALHNLIHIFGVSPLDAVRMCTQAPASSIGEGLLGRMAVGLPAPLTRWSGNWEYIGVIA